MTTTAVTSRSIADQRKRLRRRVGQLYSSLNSAKWKECFEAIDPKLRGSNRVQLETWSEQAQQFMEAYRTITPWHVRIYLHLDERAKQDPRPFAYVYTVWKDADGEFHMFRERWVEEQGTWYTRVAGLVAVQKSGSVKHRLGSTP